MIESLFRVWQDVPWSIALRESVWAYPIVETIHVLSLGVFLGLTTMLDLRLLGVALRQTPVKSIFERVMPWAWIGFGPMAASGALLVFSDPMRFYGNVFFRVKVVLLLMAGLNAVTFHFSVYRDVDRWDRSAPTPRGAQFAASVSLVLWAAVVVTGRMIAYNWF